MPVREVSVLGVGIYLPQAHLSPAHLVWAHDLNKATLSDGTQASCSEQQLLRQEAGSELHTRRIHILG